eukprot:11179211-Lingulodinium_polyedra.AAC.1
MVGQEETPCQSNAALVGHQNQAPGDMAGGRALLQELLDRLERPPGGRVWACENFQPPANEHTQDM